jgi:N-(2-amino-2-carboxyethyl)-L-glutamate synthase
LCVTDPNVSPTNLRAIRAYGGEVVTVTEQDANGGYLETRLKKVHDRLHLANVAGAGHCCMIVIH